MGQGRHGGSVEEDLTAFGVGEAEAMDRNSWKCVICLMLNRRRL